MVRVCALWRHPIKGHGREAMDEISLSEGATIPWDRRWAVAHEATRADGSEWAPCANFSRGSKVPGLMAINAVSDTEAGTVTLTHPERPALIFDPDREADKFLEWVRPIMPPERAQSARLLRVPGRGMTDTDYPSVSLMNMASNAELAKKMGQPISSLRWRCNIHVEGFAPWEEFSWIGKTLRFGEAELSIREPILRCMATTANPETGRRDLETLDALNTHWDHQNFGVYATVTKSGRITTGDRVEVV